MGTEPPTPTQDKQITIDVPADRVPEFYAVFARFLAVDRPGGRRGRRRGPGGHGHGCRKHDHDDAPAPQTTPEPAA